MKYYLAGFASSFSMVLVPVLVAIAKRAMRETVRTALTES